MGEKIEVLKSEFKKIIWPDQRTLARESAAVVITGIVLGIILAILDTVIKFLLGFIL